MTDPGRLWKGCAALLQEQLTDAVWSSSFRSVQGERLEGSTLVLSAPSSIVRARINDRFLPLIQANLSELGHEDLDLTIEVRSPDSAGARAVVEVLPEPARSTVAPVDAVDPSFHAAPSAGPLEPTNSELNRRYTFDSFVTGASNQFSHAAALRVAEQPARTYNPLFIYGEAGLGKTHLLQAIGNYVAENYHTAQIRYVTSETFLSEFIDAIRSGTNDAFKRRYRNVDLLLIDDIQFLEGRKETQEEFFHTFNALHQTNRQIVLSSDRHPDAISTLEERLKSRFVMGLMTDVQPPDLETRLAILRAKAEQETIPVPDPVLQFIAEALTDNNIRTLEGALTRLTAYASLTPDATITVEGAAETLSDLVGAAEPRPITPQAILEATAEYFGFPIEDITGRSRTRPLTNARHVAMYLFRELTDLSFPNIAREFGGRDHTTVIHAVDRIKVQMRDKQPLFNQVNHLLQQLRNAR